MTRLALLLGAALAALSLDLATARADQCALNDKAIGERALAMVAKGSTVVQFCEPCGDRQPSAEATVNTVELKNDELRVNGEEVDLAYLFIKTGKDEFRNVGLATRCGAGRVSEWIRGGTPSGPVPARSSTPSSRPPVPPRPAPPPPPVRAKTADEYTGTWEVRITTSAWTCRGDRPSPRQESWTIAVDGDQATIRRSAGELLAGRIETGPGAGMFKMRVTTAKRSSATLYEAHLFSRDRFYLRALRAEPAKKRGKLDRNDPICVVQEDIAATRK